MAKTNNNSLKLQRAVRSLFYDYQEKNGCLGTTYAQAACGCDNALQMWRGPKGDKGDQGPQGPKGDNAGSFLVSAEFVVNPAGQPEGSYLKLVLIDVAQQEQVVYVNLSELEDVYSAGNGIDITSMVIAAKLGAGLTFDNQGNITSAYQFCDGLDETSNVVKVKLDAGNNILGFAGSGCKGLTATVGLAQSSSGVNLVLTGASGAVLSTIPLEGGTGITVQKNAQTGGFTWLVDFSDVVSSTAGNNLTISGDKLYVGNSTLSYTVGDGVFTLTNPAGGTSSVTLPTVVRSLDRADLVCEGENAPYLRLTFKRDNGQNLYQDVDLSCLASALDVISDVSLDVQCVAKRDLEPVVFFGAQAQAEYITQEQYDTYVSQGGSRPTPIEAAYESLGEAYKVTLSVQDEPVYLQARVVSNFDSFWSTYNPSTNVSYVPLADVLAAGADGYPLYEPVDLDPAEEWRNYPDRRIRITAAIDEDVYVISFYWDNGVSDKPTTDLVITNAGGDETRVDMNPAINHVGGEVIDISDPEVRTEVTLREWPHTVDAEFSDGFYPSIGVYETLSDVCDGNPLEYVSSDVVDNVYYVYYTGGVPTVANIHITELTDNGDNTAAVYQTYLTVDPENNYACLDKDGNASFADLVSTGVVLYAYDNRTEKRLDDKQLYVIGELVEDGQGHPGLAIRAYLQGVKKVLRLGPSCSSDIPLADIGGIAGIETDVRCDTTPGESMPFEQILDGVISTYTLEPDGTISDLLRRYTIPTDSSARSSFTITLGGAGGSSGLGLEIYAEADDTEPRREALPYNEYSNLPLDGSGPTYPECYSLAEFLAAGEQGLPLLYFTISPSSGIPAFAENETLYAAVTDNGNSSYTFTFTVHTSDETTFTTDLVVTNSDGTEQRVDMKPLLAHVGGEVKDVVVGSESVPLIGYADEENYVGFYIDNVYFSTGNFCAQQSFACNVVTETTHDGVVDICLDAVPVTFQLDIYRINADGQEAEPNIVYTTYGSDECSGGEASSHSLIESYIAAGSAGLPLYRTNWSWSITPELSDVRLVVTPLEGENCYRLSIIQEQVAQRLCLEPSCDPCIDLTPAIGDAITSISGTVSCGVTVIPFEGGAYINGEYSDASNNVIYGISESVSSNAQVTFELPQGTATLFPEVWIADPNDSNMSYSYVFSNGIPVSELTVGARFCSDERIHSVTPH